MRYSDKLAFPIPGSYACPSKWSRTIYLLFLHMHVHLNPHPYCPHADHRSGDHWSGMGQCVALRLRYFGSYHQETNTSSVSFVSLFPELNRTCQILISNLAGSLSPPYLLHCCLSSSHTGGSPTVRLVVGDAGGPGGARAALEFPYVPRAELLQPGEAAELLVLSRDEEFVTFKVRSRGSKITGMYKKRIRDRCHWSCIVVHIHCRIHSVHSASW